MVQKGNDKSFPTKASDIIPLKKQYKMLDKIHIYNEATDQVKNYSISPNLIVYRMENAIAHTIIQMKRDHYLYKKICPSHIRKRIDGTYMHNKAGDDTEDSNCVLLQKEAGHEGYDLKKLTEDNILSDEDKKESN